MSQATIIKRAYHLVLDGSCRSLEDMRRKVKAGGFEHIEPHLIKRNAQATFAQDDKAAGLLTAGNSNYFSRLTHANGKKVARRYFNQMAHFYFDLHECGHGAVIDEEGIELPDLEAARKQAIKSAREVMASEVMEGRLCLGCAIVIRDGSGADVLAIAFAEAVEVTMTGTC